jgi:hypothetical protein
MAKMRPMQFMRVMRIVRSVIGLEVDVPIRVFAEDVEAVKLMEGVDLSKVELGSGINVHCREQRSG